MTRAPWTAAQEAVLLAKLRRENVEFAAWSAGVQAGSIPLEGLELAARRDGFRAGLLGVNDEARRKATSACDARERVAYAVGYGEGRAAREGLT